MATIGDRPAGKRGQPAAMPARWQVQAARAQFSMLIDEALAVFPDFANGGPRRLAALDHLEQAAGEAAAPPPQRPPLGGLILVEPTQVEYTLVPDGTQLRLSTTTAEGDELHGEAIPP